MSAPPISSDEAARLLGRLADDARVALAVSGGPDSLALLHLAARWRAGLRSGPALSVVTVDHGLRPESREEANTVADHAARLGLPHAILTWQHDAPPGAGLQAKARAARYALMADHAHAHDIPALVTAHHLDDQAETFLMRLKRGSGLDGLAAIPETGSWAGVAILRPLLDIPKARLVATLEAQGIPYARDPSNADPRFERARLRGALAELERLGLSAEAIALSARRLRRARAALDRQADALIAHHAALNQAGYATIGKDALLSAPDEIALRVLAKTIAAVGGSAEPVRLAKLETLLPLLREAPAKVRTLGGCRIGLSDGRIAIFRELRSAGLRPVTLEPGRRALWDNRFWMELDHKAEAPLMVKALGDAGVVDLRERELLAARVPRLAARTLPSCWRGNVLLGLPVFAGGTVSGRQDVLCRASFLSKDWPNVLSR